MLKPWILPTFASLGSFGFWGLFTKLSANYVDAKSAFVFQAIGVIIAALFSLIFLSGRVQLSSQGIIYSIFIGITYSLGCIFYFNAASKGSISTVVTITALYPLITIFLSVIFLKETLTMHQILGIFFAIVSMMFFAKS